MLFATSFQIWEFNLNLEGILYSILNGVVLAVILVVIEIVSFLPFMKSTLLVITSCCRTHEEHKTTR